MVSLEREGQKADERMNALKSMSTLLPPCKTSFTESKKVFFLIYDKEKKNIYVSHKSVNTEEI